MSKKYRTTVQRTLLRHKEISKLTFSYIDSYLTYANIIWGCNPQYNLTLLYRKQKHAIKAKHSEQKLSDTKQLLTSINALNVYQLNIFQTLLFI